MASCNYMIKSTLSKERCAASNTGKLHKWNPSGSIKAMPGGNYGVDFRCNACNKRVTEFYRVDDPVFILIKKELENALG